MAPAKVCVVCGIDVSSIKRVKDPHGNYYCQVCYDAKLADRRARAGGDPEVDFQCQTCHRFFAVEDVYDEGGTIICKSCFAARTRPAKKAPQAPAAPHVEAPAPAAPAPMPAAPEDDIPMIEPIEEVPPAAYPAAPAYQPPAAAAYQPPTAYEPPAAQAPVQPVAPVEPVDQLEVVPEEPAAGAGDWHVHDRGESHGPMSEADLITACNEGRFSTAAQIWREGMDGWEPIFRIETLLGRTI